MSAENHSGVLTAMSSEDLSISAVAVESSLINKDTNTTVTSGTAPESYHSASSCVCGVDMDGMKETRDDLLKRLKKASSPRSSSVEDYDAVVPTLLSSLYSCAPLDLDEDDDPLPVRVF
jgi:hypothetical protein